MSTPEDSIRTMMYVQKTRRRPAVKRYVISKDGSTVRVELTRQGVDALRDAGWKVETDG